MIFPAPVTAQEATDYLDQKMLLPTDMKTWAIDQLPAELRARVAISATVTKAEFLEEAFKGVKALAAGSADRAKFRLQLKGLLQQLDYQPKAGTEGTLKDLSSDRRLNLILDTNLAQANGYAYHKASQDPDLLDAYPAQEFIRVESRSKPRDNWRERWAAARNKTSPDGATNGSGRMVALKTHGIWKALSRFGTPYEPFDFNSGMGVEDVSREDAIALGLIDKDTQLQPDVFGLNEGLEMNPSIDTAALRKELEKTGLGKFDSRGVFRYQGGAS